MQKAQSEDSVDTFTSTVERRQRYGSITAVAPARMGLGIVLLSMATFSRRGEAGELGHYAPALFNVRDGVLGYSQWQVTDDDGSDARNPDVHDQVHGIGAQLGYAIPKWHLGFVMKYLYEYYAEDRFRGHALTWSIGYQF